VARIEYGMYLSGCEHAIADIVDVVEICHILPVFWPIFYDEAKPLKWQMDQVLFQANKKNVEPTSEPRSKGNDMHASSVPKSDACPYTTYITLQQPVAKIVVRSRCFQRYVRPLLDDLKINCRGEVFIKQIAHRQYL
jgi:hypothetical protein